jgi:hypothetical protein
MKRAARRRGSDQGRHDGCCFFELWGKEEDRDALHAQAHVTEPKIS